MVVMALDHIRDFFHFGAQHFNPEDLATTNAPLFFTRWITHFCAPVFVLLAGTGAYLYGRRGRTRGEVSRFLLTRGLWIIVLELTVVLFGATFNLSYAYVVLQVLWAIGCSMVALAALIWLPWRALLAISLVMIAGHNLFDSVQPDQFGTLAWMWTVLHVGPSLLPVSDAHTLIVVYPLIPWIAVMAAGYCLGRVYDLPDARRRALLWRMGLALTTAFIVIRAINLYGDPSPWAVQSRPIMTVVSFLRATKYPPSLDYLLMTIGPALMALAATDGVRVGVRNPLLVFGRVPLFYYITHWFTLHTVALLFAWSRYGRAGFLFGLPPSVLPFSTGYPADYGYDMRTVYLVWMGVVAALYPLCLWFEGVKRRRPSVWLSYL